ncbi:MAG: 2-C-methyl-D-erythritol 2,4-cyclodiphosphate synthase, partial [Planctomycetaceae bacterium]|nr:2-C-methyl-D-erythritol 2,4-cyclodiphosphate synthase [Planctomycetaceae bacterium]
MTDLQWRVGEGHDTHRTIAGRPLKLGGVEITDAETGLDGHSDAD